MSLITSCPACGTMFRVVPDQLKISEGWVRCGHCSEVFDATAHLSDESVLGSLEEAQATRSAQLRSETPAPEDSRLDSEAPDSVDAMEPAPPKASPERPLSSDLQPRPAELYARASADGQTSDRSEEPSSFFDEEGVAEALKPSPLDAPFVFRRPEVSLKELESPSEPSTASQVLPEDLVPASARTFDGGEDDDDDDEVPDVSFVRKARRRHFWSRPKVRVGLAVAAVLLAGLLALQVMYHDRDRLALSEPSLKPVLEGMCAVVGCTLSAPRQIEAIVIESSGFNRLRGDTYRLSFTLRNAAPVPVAAPAMELTVTDAQDQTVVRRVLTPAELGAEQTIPASGEWSRTLGIALDTGGATRVAGYRLLAFYP